MGQSIFIPLGRRRACVQTQSKHTHIEFVIGKQGMSVKACVRRWRGKEPDGRILSFTLFLYWGLVRHVVREVLRGLNGNVRDRPEHLVGAFFFEEEGWSLNAVSQLHHILWDQMGLVLCCPAILNVSPVCLLPTGGWS